MASTEHKNRRRALALERLNIAVARLAQSRGVGAIDIPRKMRDKDMVQIITFERMAEFLEALGGDSLPPLETNPLVIRQANREIVITHIFDEETAATLSQNLQVVDAIRSVLPATTKPKQTRKRKPKQATLRMEAK